MAAPSPKSRREMNLVLLLPNLMTIAALCSGLTGIRFAIQGQFEVAVMLILLAAVFDGLDGRLARLLHSESEIGAELDSLVDFVNFGVAPGITVYLWGLSGTQNEGWIATLVYSVCCLLRLARFNLGNRPNTEKPSGSPFTGVPSPAGAMLAMLPLYVSFMAPEAPTLPALALGLYEVLIGALMISRIRTPSFKSITVYAENVRFVVLGFVVFIAALLSHPWETLVLIDLGYVAMVLISLLRRRRPRGEI